jgi:hypothetical protein
MMVVEMEIGGIDMCMWGGERRSENWKEDGWEYWSPVAWVLMLEGV